MVDVSGTIRWGILGAGDVCEVKSGPAFQKAAHSELLAVMRRDGDKAADFARRHGVPRWYDSTEALLADPDIDAIYIATPPRFHLEHCLAALDAAKHVYLEKPMAMNATECRAIIEAEKKSPGKVAVAHYRRELPAFKRVGELIADGSIGEVRLAEVNFFLPEVNTLVPDARDNWRLDSRLPVADCSTTSLPTCLICCWPTLASLCPMKDLRCVRMRRPRPMTLSRGPCASPPTSSSRGAGASAWPPVPPLSCW
jgi:predicted dehydrogenase